MKIIDTLVPCLYTFKYSEYESDELKRLFDDWNNPIYLFEFFKNNIDDINISIEKAALKVRNEATFLRNKLLDCAYKKPNKLNYLFKNLNNNEYKQSKLTQQKARNRWLRLYAIKVDCNNYIITGGAIKLTHYMQDRPHTQLELVKLSKCKQFLNDNGVFDNDSLYELIY